MPETAPEATAAPSVSTPAADPATDSHPAAAAPRPPRPPSPPRTPTASPPWRRRWPNSRRAGKTRVNEKATAAEPGAGDLSKVLGALGLALTGPEGLDRRRDHRAVKAQADAKAAQRNLAVYLHAGEADPARLLNSPTSSTP